MFVVLTCTYVLTVVCPDVFSRIFQREYFEGNARDS